MSFRLAAHGLLACVLMLSSSGCSLAYLGDGRFKEASVSGRLQVGMSAAETRQVLGTPESVASRKTSADVRSVWTYKDRVFPRGRVPGYILLGPFTLGIIWFTPWHVETTPHSLVLTDETVLGWDLPDPFAPDLVIEHRER